MKESIMSFFNAPITNKVPSGVCSVAGLHCLYLLRFPSEGADTKSKGRYGKR